MRNHAEEMGVVVISPFEEGGGTIEAGGRPRTMEVQGDGSGSCGAVDECVLLVLLAVNHTIILCLRR